MAEIDLNISYLNSVILTKLAPSSIHGVGLFALKDLKAGDKLYADAFPVKYEIPYEKFGGFLPEVREQIVNQFPLVASGSAFLWPTTRLQAFCNHSDDPNYAANLDVMLSDCKAGEEITEDYKHIIKWEELFPWIK